MMQQQQILQEKLSISQILRIYGKQFAQIRKRYSDGRYGRCAMGVIMSYFGWNGKDDSAASGKLLGALIVLRHNNINEDLFIRLNDSGATFDEIADYLDRICE